MSVRVQLDRAPGDVYTNHDLVTGRVLLSLPTDATITAITVKLEGETKTRLDGPKSSQDQDRKKTLLEVHKLLYKVLTVFPTQELQSAGANMGKTAQYTVSRGQYEYPFEFKIPFNSDCMNNTSLIKDLKVGGLSVQFGQEPIHSKLLLPPSLGGFAGLAEIKYFVKATVVRPKFYQENLRNEVPISFWPIEQPRPQASDGETYGRRKHQFQRVDTPNITKRKPVLRQNSMPSTSEAPLSFQVDARLPNPAIITSGEPLPLRIIIERLNSSTSPIYLSTLQIELIHHTVIRAHDLQRTESSSWLLLSQANMDITLERPSDKRNSWIVPSRLWDNVRLPPDISPTFKTCNIRRKYELEVRVGLTPGIPDWARAGVTQGIGQGVRPELIVSPIRLDVDVYSGIRPSPQLADAIAQAQPSMEHHSQQSPDRRESIPPRNADVKQSNYGQRQQSQAPALPLRSASSSQQQYQPQPGRSVSYGSSFVDLPLTNGNVMSMIHDDDLPPSYDDAMAEELAPVDGRRPQGYAADASSQPQSQALNPGSKTGLGRRVSERLFASNAPRTPGMSSSSSAPSGDMLRYGGDLVHEEPEEVDHESSSMRRQSFGIEGAGEDDYRPPLPIRRSEQHTAVTLNDSGGKT